MHGRLRGVPCRPLDGKDPRAMVPIERIRRAPKVVLHDHLDGGLRPATIVELADELAAWCAANGLGAHLDHQVRAHDAIREAREVFDIGGVHQFPAGGDRTGNEQRLQVGAGRVDGSGQAGRP